jgi:galactokinase
VSKETYYVSKETYTQAARHFGVTALRDVSSSELQLRAAELEPDTLRRARHVITGVFLMCS